MKGDLTPALLLLLALAAGCREKPASLERGDAAPDVSREAGAGDGGSAANRDSSDAAAAWLLPVTHTESDFVEGERNRDPFRNFATGPTHAAHDQRDIELAQYSVDELRLVAIVHGGGASRAMFVDPTGKGTIVTRGTFVGRPEAVRGVGATGAPYAVPWRVDRIREGDVVLIREDPSRLTSVPASRVIPLHPEEEARSPR